MYIFLLCFASAKVAEAGKRQNLKKESKAYSYEDQIWEMEVREVTLSPDFYATRFQWMDCLAIPHFRNFAENG